MKKIIIIALCVITSLSAFSQADSTKSCCHKPAISGYMSASISVTNGTDFKMSSYPALEGGIMYENLTFGVAAGRGNLSGIGKSDDVLSNYWGEAKVYASFPIGKVNGSVIFGYGAYFNTSHNFIEYGVGVSYTAGKLGYGVSCTSWDNTVYISPSLTLNF